MKEIRNSWDNAITYKLNKFYIKNWYFIRDFIPYGNILANL